MNTTPQAVTERYVTNLINYGRNREFDIASISRQITQKDGIVVGVYFDAILTCPDSGEEGHKTQMASGATISQAVRRALEKHGVTFR